MAFPFWKCNSGDREFCACGRWTMKCSSAVSGPQFLISISFSESSVSFNESTCQQDQTQPSQDWLAAGMMRTKPAQPHRAGSPAVIHLAPETCQKIPYEGVFAHLSKSVKSQSQTRWAVVCVWAQSFAV